MASRRLSERPARTVDGSPTLVTMRQMELLTSVYGSFTARVLVARLYDEGIDAELRGPVDSPYGLTIGDLARIDVFVPPDQVEDARFVLLVNEVEEATTLPERPRLRRGLAVWGAALAAVCALGALAAPFAHWLSGT
jgi:hypothetical protein